MINALKTIAEMNKSGKDVMNVAFSKDLKAKIKDYAKDSGLTSTKIISIALVEFFKINETEKKNNRKPVIRQCSVVTCMRPYDTNIHDACPKCGNKELYN